MADKKENRLLIEENDLRQQMLSGAEAAYKAVGKSYGPKGMTLVIERNFGRPTYSRDGLTIIEQVYFSDRVKNIGAQSLAEASRTANNISGDGSSGTVVFGYHLLANSVQAIAAGQHPMDVSDTLVKDSHLLADALKKLVIPIKDKQLKEVATVSAGDPLLGELIADAILYVGQDGGILTEKAPITEIERTYVDGYYLQSGFIALQAGKKDMTEPHVVVSSKRLSSSADAIEILNGIMKAKNLQPGQVPKILFVGNIEDAAYTTIVNTINQGQIDAVIVKTPPMYGEYGKYLLSDIAVYAGCEPITDNTSLKSFSGRFIGTVDRVTANKSEATIFAANDTDAVKDRILEIKDQIESEQVPAILEKLKDRVAKLEGKIAIFKIGGVNDSVREETEFRLDDAINSTRHAYNNGVVIGGGITLLELSKTAGISDITRKALQSTFQKLLENAVLPTELKLVEALNAPKGYGFNLRKGGELVDLKKEGIFDPYVVVREIVSNALGTAANVAKAGMGLTYDDPSEK